MAQCIFLSESELQDLMNMGWTQVAGPFANESDCLANCGSSGSAGSAGSQVGSSELGSQSIGSGESSTESGSQSSGSLASSASLTNSAESTASGSGTGSGGGSGGSGTGSGGGGSQGGSGTGSGGGSQGGGSGGSGTGSSGSGSGSSSSSAAPNVPICCVPGGIPQTLHVTYTDLGNCSCLGGFSVPIIWDGTTNWVGSGTACGNTITVTLKNKGVCSWELDAKCGAAAGFFIAQSSFQTICTPAIDIKFGNGFPNPTCGGCTGGISTVKGEVTG